MDHNRKTTECAYCGKEIEWNQKLFEEGCTGEPACKDCKKEEGVDTSE